MRSARVALLACVIAMTGTASARQDNALPAEVLDAYSAYEAAVSASDWEQAVLAARTAAEAGDRERVDAATRAVLWENLGIAYMRQGLSRDTARLADLALERARDFSRDAGDEAGDLRLQFRLIESALSAQNGAIALDRMDAFEIALAQSTAGAPDFERRYLTARLHGTRPLFVQRALPLETADRRRVARLLELAAPGRADYIIARHRLIVDAIAREEWSEAESLIFETTAQVSRASPGSDGALVDFIGLFSYILAEGFDDDTSSGVERWPLELAPVWCAYLDGRAIVTRRTPPIYPPHAAELAQEGSVTLVFRINEFGQFEDIVSAEPIGGTRRVFIRPAEQAVRGWQWRAQCNPQPGVFITDTTTIEFRLG